MASPAVTATTTIRPNEPAITALVTALVSCPPGPARLVPPAWAAPVAGVGRRVEDIDLSAVSAASGKSAEELGQLPGVLVGSSRQIADTLLRYRDEFGISYVSVLEDHTRVFAEVIPLLR